MRERSPLLPIFLIVLVDVLGFTIVIPLLALYAERFGASPLVATTIVSVYAACSLVSTPVIGNLSDRFGRRRMLLVSQAGTFAGFVMLGNATALWMVFAGRILDGITAGNLSIAQAYISDHTKPEDRAKAFGIIGIAFGVGFMFGPALGGYLGQSSMHLPFIVSACLSALSMACTYFLLPRDAPPAAAPVVEATAAALPGGKRPSAFAFATYTEYFRREGLGNIYLQFFLFTFAFSCFTSGFALFAEHNYGWGARDTGYLFAYSGFIGALLQGGLIGRLVKKYGEVKLVLYGFVSAIAAYVIMGLAPGWKVLAIASIFSAFGNGVLRPVLTSRITQAVGRHEQGIAIGISGSLSSFAMTMAPPAGGTFLDRDWLLAWALVPATAALLGLIVAIGNRKTVLPGNLPKATLHSEA